MHPTGFAANAARLRVMPTVMPSSGDILVGASMPKTTIRQHDVPPKDGAKYEDGFYATLYSALASFGQNEQRLIWMRYAGFLVLQGFLVSTFLSGHVERKLLAPLGLAGMASSAAWHFLNFAGWLNQNYWFSRAASLRFTGLTVQLPTDYWTDLASLRPTGIIYRVAQFVAISLLLVHACIVGWSLVGFDVALGLVIPVVILVLVLVVTLLVVLERLELSSRAQERDGRPVS